MRDYFWCFSCLCYAPVIMPNTRNQSTFSTPHWLSIWEHGWILVLLLISVARFKLSNSSISGYKFILIWFGCIIRRPKWYFAKMVTLRNRLHNKLNPDIFHIFISFEFSIYPVFIVPNLKYIHAIFMMLWPFKLMLVPRCSTGWSVAKLIFGSVLYQIGGKHWPHILVYVKFRSLASSSIKSNSCYHSCYFR